jgi:hypothetical protein
VNLGTSAEVQCVALPCLIWGRCTGLWAPPYPFAITSPWVLGLAARRSLWPADRSVNRSSSDSSGERRQSTKSRLAISK